MNRDPIRSAGNLYGYAAAAPISSADPTGLVTVHDVAGRGYFVAINLANVDNPGMIGTQMSASWTPIPNQFLDANNDPLCEAIGYVQVIKGSILRMWGINGHTWSDWQVDGTFTGGYIPYPYPRDSNTMGYPNTAQEGSDFVQIIDDGAGGSQGWNDIASIDLEFETCVVCLSGKEGIKTRSQSCPTDVGPPPTTTWISDITVYGCFTWSTRITRQVGGRYLYQRTLNGRNSVMSNNGNLAVIGLDENGDGVNWPGAKSTANFKRGIENFIHF